MLNKLILILTLIILSSSQLSSNLPANNDRIPSSIDSSFLQNKFDSCTKDWQCEGDLYCRGGICLSKFDKLPYGEFCGTHNQCLSNFCNNGTCGGNNQMPNNFQCKSNSDCRSGLCLSTENQGINKRCFASSSFKGFYDDFCQSSSGCLSGKCQNSKCQFGSTILGCAEIGSSVLHPSQCCSGRSDLNACAPVSDNYCTIQQNCRGRVGRTCASLNMQVKSPSLCCSGNASSNGGGNYLCLPRNDNQPSPCAKDSDCSYPQKCNQKNQICTH